MTLPAQSPPAPSSTTYALVAAAILIALLWLGARIAYQPAPPSAGEAPTDEFSSKRALSVLHGLVGDSVPHPMGSAANLAVRDRILAQLRQLGYEPELQNDIFVCDSYAVCGAPQNILVRIPGRQDESGGVLLSSHYDSVPAGPGASDDGTGVAAVLEIARILKATPPALNPIVLLIDDGEEAGLLGAQAFATHHRWAGSIKAAVNIDNRGTSGPSLMFETGSANRWLMQLYSHAVAQPRSNSLYYAIYKLLPNDTDFTVFKKAGYQGFNFGYIGDVANYHTPQDDLAHVSLASLQQHGDNALATVRELANANLDSAPAGEAVYFDVFGMTLISFPQQAALPAAILTLLLILLVATWLVRRHDIRLRELSWSLGGLALAYIVAVALGVALILVVRHVNPAGMPVFTASPWVLVATCVAAAATVLSGLSLLLWRRASFWSLWCANAVWTALFGLILALKLTGACYLAILPAIAALIGLAARCLVRGERLLPQGATLGFLLLSFGLLCPILAFLYDGLGRPGLPLLTLLPVYGAAPLAALLLSSGRSVQRVATGVSLTMTLLGSAVAAAIPAYSVRSPQPLNLHYLEESTGATGTPHAHWLISQSAPRLAQSLLQQLSFSSFHPQPFNPLLVLGRSQFTADAPVLAMSSPSLALVSVAPSAAGKPARLRYQIHVNPNATVSALRIAFAPEGKVQSIAIAPSGPEPREPFIAVLNNWGENWQVLSIVNPPPQGLDLSFEAADVPYEMDMTNVTYGLPSEGAQLLQARPADTTAIQGGNDTLVATTVRISSPKP